MAHRPGPISIDDAIASLTFLPDRSPTTSDEDSVGAFARLADYRDGAVFVGDWAGSSEWERHPVGDEIVMVIDGRTTLFLLGPDGERGHQLAAGELLVVPRGTWHRFETPERVKVLSVTPQPTEHRAEQPSAGA